MSGPFFSSLWYRVAEVRPRLKAHVRVFPQRFRGVCWYVMQDPQTGRYHRLAEAASLAVSLMDGERTVAQIWEALGERLGEHQPAQDDLIRLLRQLHSADVLAGDRLPDLGELTRRSRDQSRRELMTRLRNPISLRIPLFDPNRFLARTLHWVAPVFTRLGFIAWLVLVGVGIGLAALHWDRLTADVADRALAPSNLVLMLLVYPIVKAIHELGHAYATRRWGGEVHEIGVMLLILFPVPYVDASDAAGFPNKWHRAIVGAAGIMVELALASLALFVWLAVEPGPVRAVAFSVMLITSVSTVLFNGNPLLRYDGYYVLGDLIAIPNLGPRSTQYLAYLAKTRLLGVKDASNPVSAPGEAFWFVAYGVSSYFYRMAITAMIALYLAKSAFLLGVTLALIALFTAFVVPIWRGARYLATSPEIRGHRGRALASVALVVAVFAALLFAIPAPYSTKAQGVVWLPEQATVRAGTGGNVVRVLAQPGSLVRAGDALVEIEDPFLQARVQILEARKAQLVFRLNSALVSNLVTSRMFEEQLKQVNAALKQEETKRAALFVRANSNGRLALRDAADLPGRLIERGAILGYVIEPHRVIVRALVPQDDIDLILHRLKGTQVRFAQHVSGILPARAFRATPGAVERSPSPVLSREGGGPWAEVSDPTGQPRLVEKAFLVDVVVDSNAPGGTVGSRVYLRFDHGYEALAFRAARGLRQLFLRQLDV